MSLLPSKPDASPPDDAGPRVIGVDSDDADDVLSALSSGTARELLTELHDDPAPPSELADTVDTSVQNVKYHLDKLESAGAIEIVDTAYSEKGREMDVYAPSDQPLVIFAGDEQKGSTLRTALSRLLGAVGILGIASLAIQSVFGDGLLPSLGAGGDAAQETGEPAGESGGAYQDGGGESAPRDGGDGASGADEEMAEEEAADGGMETADVEEEGTDGDLEAADVEDETDTTDSGGGDGGDTVDGGTGGDGGDTVDGGTGGDGGDTVDGGTGGDGGDTVDGGTGGDAVDGGADGGTDAIDAEPDPEMVPNDTVSPDAVPGPDEADAIVDGAASLPPGLLFFAGGLFAILLVAAYLHFR